MSLTVKKTKGIDYLYFQAGVGKTFYLDPKDNPSKLNLENLEKAIDYVKNRINHYEEIQEKLVSLIPERDEELIFKILHSKEPDMEKNKELEDEIKKLTEND